VLIICSSDLSKLSTTSSWILETDIEVDNLCIFNNIKKEYTSRNTLHRNASFNHFNQYVHCYFQDWKHFSKYPYENEKYVNIDS